VKNLLPAARVSPDTARVAGGSGQSVADGLRPAPRGLAQGALDPAEVAIWAVPAAGWTPVR